MAGVELIKEARDLRMSKQVAGALRGVSKHSKPLFQDPSSRPGPSVCLPLSLVCLALSFVNTCCQTAGYCCPIPGQSHPVWRSAKAARLTRLAVLSSQQRSCLDWTCFRKVSLPREHGLVWSFKVSPTVWAEEGDKGPIFFIQIFTPPHVCVGSIKITDIKGVL